MKKYKVGIVGAGGVTELHFAGYKEHPERLEVVAICDPNAAALHAKAERHGIPRRYTELDDLIRDGGIDAAVVCTPSPIRKEVLFPLIEAGLPVFVEKPFSDTLAEAAEITAKAVRSGVPVSVNQNFRRHFPFELIREIVADGTIGSVTSMTFTNLFFRQDAGWRLECERHALAVMGIHWFDGFRRILGSEAKSVHCLNRSSAAINCAGETDATVQVAFENGAVATYVQSFSSAFGRTELIVIGEAGTLVAEYGKVELYRNGDRAPAQIWKNEVSRESATYEGMDQLLVSIETGEEAPNSAQDNLKTIAMLDAAYVSAREHRIVHLSQVVGVATITDLRKGEAGRLFESDWGKIQWLCGRQIDPDSEMTFGMVYIHAGQANPRHLHPNCEEIIFVLSGECDHTLGGETYRLEPGMMLRIPRNVPHNATAVGWEPCRMIIAYSSPDRQTILE